MMETLSESTILHHQHFSYIRPYEMYRKLEQKFRDWLIVYWFIEIGISVEILY